MQSKITLEDKKISLGPMNGASLSFTPKHLQALKKKAENLSAHSPNHLPIEEESIDVPQTKNQPLFKNKTKYPSVEDAQRQESELIKMAVKGQQVNTKSLQK